MADAAERHREIERIKLEAQTFTVWGIPLTVEGIWTVAALIYLPVVGGLVYLVGGGHAATLIAAFGSGLALLAFYKLVAPVTQRLREQAVTIHEMRRARVACRCHRCGTAPASGDG